MRDHSALGNLKQLLNTSLCIKFTYVNHLCTRGCFSRSFTISEPKDKTNYNFLRGAKFPKRGPYGPGGPNFYGPGGPNFRGGQISCDTGNRALRHSNSNNQIVIGTGDFNTFRFFGTPCILC